MLLFQPSSWLFFKNDQIWQKPFTIFWGVYLFCWFSTYVFLRVDCYGTNVVEHILSLIRKTISLVILHDCSITELYLWVLFEYFTWQESSGPLQPFILAKYCIQFFLCKYIFFSYQSVIQYLVPVTWSFRCICTKSIILE